MRLGKKIVVVTGGLSGIGEAVAPRMVREGSTVVAADRSAKKDTLGSDALLPLPVDAMMRTAITRFGRLD